MPDIGFQELILILVIALLVFGPKKLPEPGRAVWDGIVRDEIERDRATPS